MDSLTVACPADLVGRRKLHSREWKYAPAAIGASGAVTAIVILGCCTNPRAIVYVYGTATLWDQLSLLPLHPVSLFSRLPSFNSCAW